MLILIGFGIPVLLARARRGSKSDHPDNLAIAEPSVPKPGYLLQPGISDAIDVFDLVALLELRRAARLCQVLRPASRDLIRYRAVRQRQSSRPSDVIPRDDKQQRPRATSFLPTSSPSTISGRLGHPWFHKNWARTSDKIQHLEASRSIFSSRYMQNRHRR